MFPGKFPSSFHPRTPRAGDALALAAGALLPWAFAPAALWPLAFISPALLFLLWGEGTPARAAWRGFLFGLGLFGLGVSWVYVSLHRYGHMPAPLAGLATLLLVAGLALYPAALGYLQARWRTNRLHLALVLPVLWCLFEWWRGWFLTGFPWLNLGYSQADTWLAGYAAWLGVYGVSLACALIAGQLALMLQTPTRAATRRGLALGFALFVAGGLAGRADWTEPAGAPLPVTLVQGNVPIETKWLGAQRAPILERYLELTAGAAAARLIVWPEAAIPATLAEVTHDFLTRARTLAARRDAALLVGVVERDPDGRRYYNSVVTLTGEGGGYRKQHLVPFGEFLPLPGLFRPLLDTLRIPMSDFSRGAPDQPPLAVAGQKLGLSVCYEDAFGEELIRQLPAATLLVNVSEDAWFGDSLAPHQRLQMARLRALEAGRPMLRAANTGPSAAIDHRGRVLAQSGQFRAETLTVSVEPRQGATPYVRWGNAAVLVLLALLLAVAARRGVVRRG